MPLLRTTAVGAILASAVWLAALSPATSAGSSDETDASVKPGDDFYQYANGGWLKGIVLAAGQASYDTRALLNERTSQRVRDLIQGAAADHAGQTGVSQKVGDYYASIMDEAGIESRKFTPLSGEMSAIAAISSKPSLAAYLGSTLSSEVDGLTSNSDHIFGMWINQGFRDTSHNVVHFWQGGLGMPDRDHYLDQSPKMTEVRHQYQAHIAAVLKLAGVDGAEARSAQVLSLETHIAQAFAPDADAADVFKQNNPWMRTEFTTKAPGMDWDAYFKTAGLAAQQDFIVWQPSAVTGVAALVKSESLEVWKDYLRFHLIEHYSAVLPTAVSTEHFAFYGKILNGSQQEPARTQTAIAATNGALGQAVGQLYTQRYFPPDAKVQAQAMAANLVAAYRSRIAKLTWMSAATKTKALDKLAALEVKVGYPDHWIDYSKLEIRRDDALGNMRRAEAYLRARNLAKLRQPVDPIEWPIDAQTPGAVIMFSPNAEFFSAGILQPPYFDPHGDAASNYGSAGAGMAHEISHSFDELGNIYDAHGGLGNWWTAEDKAQYQAAAGKMAAQLDAYCPFSDLCVKGKQVLGESIADQAGLLAAHDAYILSRKGHPDTVIGGLSGEQRFFLAFAQRWRRAQTEGALRNQVKTDTHLPGKYRSDSVRNVDAWYEAFSVSPADKLYLRPEDRVRVW